MIVFSYLGRLLILLALGFLGLGLWLWLSGEDITLAGGQLWYNLHPASLNTTQVVVERYLSVPALWHDAIVPYLLQRPTWEGVLWMFIGLFVTGGILMTIGHRRHQRHSFRN